jgi:hypothetical protein
MPESSVQIFACTHCGYIGQRRTMSCGQVFVVLVLCPTVILAVLIAIYFDYANKRCPQCETMNLLPVTTPKGRQIWDANPDAARAALAAAEARPAAAPASPEVAQRRKRIALAVAGAVVLMIGGCVIALLVDKSRSDERERVATAAWESRMKAQTASATESITPMVQTETASAASAQTETTVTESVAEVEQRQSPKYELRQIEENAPVYVDKNVFPRRYHLQGCPSIRPDLIKAPYAGMASQGITIADDCRGKPVPTRKVTRAFQVQE